MNSLMEERLAEAHRQDLIREIRFCRQLDEISRNKGVRPGWFNRLLHLTGHWLITNGEKLARQYEPHRKECQPSRQSYAH